MKIGLILSLALGFSLFSVQAGGERMSSVVVGRADIFAILKSRPRQCPLVGKAASYGQVMARLRDSLKNFKCKEQGTGLGELRDQVTSLSDSYSDMESDNQQVLKGMQHFTTVLDGLVEIKDDRQCLGDLHKRSFLGTLADSILSITQWGVLSDDGFKIAAGGIVLSSVLRIIDRFFNRKYDWNNDNDRMLFNKLNCSFYDIRFDLHQLGLFRLSSEQSRNREQQLKSELQELHYQSDLFEGDGEQEEIERELRAKKSQLQAFVHRNSRGQYRLDDSGVVEIVALQQYYDAVAKNIYGRQGRQFVEMLQKQLGDALQGFNKGYKHFEQQGNFARQEFSAMDLGRACGEASVILRKWGQADEWGQYAFDFVLANLDIFHGPKERGNYKREMRKEAFSALYAKAWIDRYRGAVIEEIPEGHEEQYSLSVKSIGGRMVEVYSQLPQAQNLENFIQGQCREIQRL